MPRPRTSIWASLPGSTAPRGTVTLPFKALLGEVVAMQARTVDSDPLHPVIHHAHRCAIVATVTGTSS